MSVLRNIIFAVLLVSLVTFVALFGRLPALRKTPIGRLQRLLCIHLPNALQAVDDLATGGRASRKCQRLCYYLFQEKHPWVLVIFLIILTGSATLFLVHAFHHLPMLLLFPVPPLLACPYAFTYLSASYRAHHITQSNHEIHMRDYPYDYMLFRPNVVCRTCNLVKPARSKHCGFCGVCVARCDHHCPWVNNCLGRGNYRYFLALLLTLTLVQLYGAFLSWWLLRSHFHMDPAHPIISYSRLKDIGNSIVVAANRGGVSIAGVGLLAGSTACLPMALLAYHCYLIWAGMTTNESQKWADWREDMTDGFVFKGERKQLQAYYAQRKGRFEADGPVAGLMADLEDCNDRFVRWPSLSESVLVRTSTGRPPEGQEALWDRIWSLSDVDNIYDLGGQENLVHILREG